MPNPVCQDLVLTVRLLGHTGALFAPCEVCLFFSFDSFSLSEGTCTLSLLYAINYRRVHARQTMATPHW